jgi:hypothetical protein
MADFNNIKKKNKLGTPPKPTETKGNLDKPEVAPASDLKTDNKGKQGRPKTDKTERLSTKLRPDFKKKLKRLSLDLDKDIGDIIQEAVEFRYKKEL